jgi:hypothetical protein
MKLLAWLPNMSARAAVDVQLLLCLQHCKLARRTLVLLGWLVRQDSL